MSDLLTLSDADFTSTISGDKPVLVDFWAEWCMPCRMLAPVIDKLAEKYGDSVKVGKLDTDGNRDTAVKYGISSIPTVILIKDGEAVTSFQGMQPEAAYADEIDRLDAAARKIDTASSSRAGGSEDTPRRIGSDDEDREQGRDTLHPSP